MINQFLDLNYVQMASFNNLKGKSKNKFFYKLLRWADYTESTRDYLLGLTGLSNPNGGSGEARVKRNQKPRSDQTPNTSKNQKNKKRLKKLNSPPINFTY